MNGNLGSICRRTPGPPGRITRKPWICLAEGRDPNSVHLPRRNRLESVRSRKLPITLHNALHELPLAPAERGTVHSLLLVLPTMILTTAHCGLRSEPPLLHFPISPFPAPNAFAPGRKVGKHLATDRYLSLRILDFTDVSPSPLRSPGALWTRPTSGSCTRPGPEPQLRSPRTGVEGDSQRSRPR